MQERQNNTLTRDGSSPPRRLWRQQLPPCWCWDVLCVSRTVRGAGGLHPLRWFGVVPGLGTGWQERLGNSSSISPSPVLMSLALVSVIATDAYVGCCRWCSPARRVKKDCGGSFTATEEQEGHSRAEFKAQPAWRKHVLEGTGETSHKVPLFNFIDL